MIFKDFAFLGCLEDTLGRAGRHARNYISETYQGDLNV
jgi:hypothetical protein